MKTKFWETRSGSCLLRMGMARQSPAVYIPGGQLRSVPDASQPPTPHHGAGRNQGKVPLAWPQDREPNAHPSAPQPQHMEDVFVLGVSFGYRVFNSLN